MADDANDQPTWPAPQPQGEAAPPAPPAPPAASAPPTPAASPAPSAPAASAGNRRPLVIVAICAVVVLVVGLIVALGGGDDDKASNDGNSSHSSDGSGGSGSQGSGGGTGSTQPGIDAVPAILSADGTVFDFNSDGSQIAIGGSQAQLSLWNVNSAQQVFAVQETSHTIIVSRDGQTVFSYSETPDPVAPILGPAHSYRTSDGKEVSGFAVAGESAPHVSPVATKRGAVIMPTPEGLTVFNMRTAHKDMIIPLAEEPEGLVASVGGGTIVVNMLDHVEVYDVDSGALEYTLGGGGSCTPVVMTGSADSRMFAGYDQCSNSVVVWKALDGNQIAGMQDSAGLDDFVAFTPDNRFVVACGLADGADHICTVYDAATGAAVTSVSMPESLGDTYRQPEATLTASLHPSGKLLAVSLGVPTGDPGVTVVYDLTTSAAVSFARGLTAAAFSPDQFRLAGVFRTQGEFSPDGQVRVYDLLTLPAS